MFDEKIFDSNIFEAEQYLLKTARRKSNHIKQKIVTRSPQVAKVNRRRNVQCH